MNLPMKKIRKIQIAAVSLLLVVVMAIGAGCSCSAQVTQEGWAPAAIGADNVYLATSEGTLVTLSKLNGNKTAEDIKVNTGNTAAGILSCGMAGKGTVIYGTPYINGDLISVAGYDGMVYTYSITTHLSNSIQLDEDKGMSIVGGIAGDGDILYIPCSDGCVYALNSLSLTREWSFETGDKVWATPVLDNGILYVASFDAKIYALDASDGTLKWSYETNGPIMASPVVKDGVVYVCSFDRTVYALNANDGSVKWNFTGSGDKTPSKWFWATPVIASGYLCVPNMDGTLYVLKVESGELAYSFDYDDQLSSSPVAVDNIVYFATEKGVLWSLDLPTGAPVQLHDFEKTIDSGLVVDGDVIYVHTQTKESLYAVNRSNGLVSWYYEV